MDSEQTQDKPVTILSLGLLEEKLFAGTATINDVFALLQGYQRKGNTAQSFRILDIVHTWFKNTKETLGEDVLYIKRQPEFRREGGICFFPFSSAEAFLSPAATYGLEMLTYLIRECRIGEVLLAAEIAQSNPEICRTIETLCAQCSTQCRIMGEKDARKAHKAIDLQDSQNFRHAMQVPREIALSPMIGPCNIKCNFCEQAYKKYSYREMDFDLFKQAVRAIPPKIAIKTSLTPFQEPLTTKSFMKYLGFALKERPQANIGFNTNGICLTEKVSRTLIEMGCKYLIISLNMPDEKSYQNFCGKDFFATVKKNILSLHELKAQCNSTYPRTSLQFLNAFPVLGNEDSLRQTWQPYVDAVFFTNIHAPTKDFVLPGHTNSSEEDADTAKPTTQIVLEAGTPCASMLFTCAVDMQGYYLPCCALMIKRNEINKRKYKFMEIGHVSEMDMLTAWQSPKWRQLRAWQVAGLLSTCKRCDTNTLPRLDAMRLKNGLMTSYAFPA